MILLIFKSVFNMHTFEHLQGEPSAYELERLQAEVSSLSHRIGSLTCLTATDRYYGLPHNYLL